MGRYVLYPAYRAKNGHVNTLAERLQGCFRFSMNGKAPPADDPTLTALQTYMFWLASKAPTGVVLEGQGYRKLPPPAAKADYLRGSEVYAQYCAVCHGAEGQGQKNGKHWVFPALWGPDSFNWGAGMHQIGNAAGFIKANMPLSQAGMLSDQEAWDVAYFMNAHDVRRIRATPSRWPRPAPSTTIPTIRSTASRSTGTCWAAARSPRAAS